MNERAYRESGLKSAQEANQVADCAPQSAGTTIGSAWRQQQIVEQFTYHTPSPEQQTRLNLIREAGKMLALTIQANTPPGDEQSSAIMNVRVGVMLANAAVVGADR